MKVAGDKWPGVARDSSLWTILRSGFENPVSSEPMMCLNSTFTWVDNLSFKLLYQFEIIPIGISISLKAETSLKGSHER